MESFIASQKSKDQHWLAQSAKDADLEIDEMMLQDLQGDAEDDAWEEGEWDCASGGSKWACAYMYE